MKMGAEMRIGLYQFPGSGDMGKNYETIEKAVSQAASQKVRFLAFHECALTGYPPLEVCASLLPAHLLSRLSFPFPEWVSTCFRELISGTGP